MGRKDRQLFPDRHPLHAFAQQLRDLRKRSGDLTYAAMARRTQRSSTALSEAAGGDKLPTWETVAAYVTACGDDPVRYRVLWETAAEQHRQEDVTDYDPRLRPPTSGALFNPPRHPARLFVGREDVLAEMDQFMGEQGRGVALGPALHGLGGIGKTELALQFTYRHQVRYNPVWWVNADTAENVTAGLAALTRSIEPRWPMSAGLADTAAWAARWLAAHDGWLLVLDNVVDVRAVEPVLAVAINGRVVITSRRRLDWRVHGLTPLLVPELSREESVDLLASRTGRGHERDEFAALAGGFAGLPLALNHAAAYLVERPHVTLSQYREWLEDQPSRVLGTALQSHPGDDLVLRTWQVSIDAIAGTNPLALTALDVISYLAADRLPVRVLVPLADALAVDDAVALLASYSLVSRTGTTISVHRLVQTVVRLTHAGPAVLETAIRLLRHALPTGDPESVVGDWAMWEEVAPHVAALSGRLGASGAALTAESVFQVGEVLQRCGLYHRGQGRYENAVALFEQSLALQVEVLGPEHQGTVEARYMVAAGYWSIGRLQDAVELATSTLEARRRTLGPDHLATLQNATHVALGLRELGHLDEATSLTEETRTRLSRTLGEDHPETLRARNNLAGCYRANGRHDEAMTLYLSTLADRRRVLGHLHPDTLQSQHNLAGGYEATGRLHEAVDQLESVLRTRVDVLGPDHPDTSHTRFNLARVCSADGRHEQAETLLEETVRSRSWRLGPAHPDTVKAEAALAEVRLALRTR